MSDVESFIRFCESEFGTAVMDREAAYVKRHVTTDDRILDVGCGAGRDMMWLANRGFSCVGLDCSPALAELARHHTELSVIEADFDYEKEAGYANQTLPDGRVFYLWPKAELMPIFEDCGLRCLEYFEQQSKIRATDIWMSFVLIFYFTQAVVSAWLSEGAPMPVVMAVLSGSLFTVAMVHLKVNRP